MTSPPSGACASPPRASSPRAPWRRCAPGAWPPALGRGLAQARLTSARGNGRGAVSGGVHCDRCRSLNGGGAALLANRVRERERGPRVRPEERGRSGIRGQGGELGPPATPRSPPPPRAPPPSQPPPPPAPPPRGLGRRAELRLRRLLLLLLRLRLLLLLLRLDAGFSLGFLFRGRGRGSGVGSGVGGGGTPVEHPWRRRTRGVLVSTPLGEGARLGGGAGSAPIGPWSSPRRDLR